MTILMQEVHAPCIYETLPADNSAKASSCSLVVQVLEDALANCLILHDDQGFLLKHAVSSLSSWPQAHRKRAQELLEELNKRKRFVAIPFAPGTAPSVLPNDCRLASHLAAQATPDALIFSQGCPICSVRGSTGICLESYSVSSFYDERKAQERIELGEGDWTKEKFEAEVWQPLFRYAKRVHIVDRYIGRSVECKSDRATVKADFARSLRWIVEQFANAGRGGHRSVEISCGVREDRLKGEKRTKAVRALKDFGGELAQDYAVSVKVNVKLEQDPPQQVPHARFIFTDQLCLQIDPGVDLLTREGKVKRTIISLHRDRARVEADVRNLKDA